MTPKYFYVIENDNQIHEIQFTPERYAEAVKSLVDKGIFALHEGVAINMPYVKKIVVGGDPYENYIDTVSPKHYVKDGIVRKTKDGSIVRILEWKKKEIERIKRIEETTEEPIETPETFKKFVNSQL